MNEGSGAARVAKSPHGEMVQSRKMKRESSDRKLRTGARPTKDGLK